MTSHCSLVTTVKRFRVNGRQRSALLTCLLFTGAAQAVLLGCGARTDDPSTDTGNPPVIAESKLRVVASEKSGEVVVVGSKGAVSPGAEITVTNVKTKQSERTQAASDGSFEVSVGGSVTDEYRVEAELNGKTNRAAVGSSATDTDFEGHSFVLESVDGFELVEGSSVTLSFNNGSLGLNAGCNSMSGPYSKCDGSLCVNDVQSTAIGCNAELHAQDERFREFLTSKPKFIYAPPRLTLSDSGTTFEFLDREVADPDRPLTERTWTFTTMSQGEAARNAPLVNPATIQFNDDGTFFGYNSCNALTGAYVADASTLTFSDVVTDDAFCEDDLDFQSFFGSFLNAGTCTYEIDANVLVLTLGNNSLSAITD